MADGVHDALGLASGTVVVVPYDPAWPRLFEAEAARLRASLGPTLPLADTAAGASGASGPTMRRSPDPARVARADAARPLPTHRPPMEILVATSADFALLRDGRPVASGAWDDVRQVRAGRRPGGPSAPVFLALRLLDGREFVAQDDAPGWDDFLDAAESSLPGMPRPRTWWPALQAADEGAVVILFARDDRGC